MSTAIRRLTAAAAAVLVLGACSSGGDDAGVATDGAVDRTVEIGMRDIAYATETLEVKEGETVRFVFDNAGEIPHDAFIGDRAAQDGHEKEMRAGDDGGHDGGMGGKSGGDDAVTVEPGDDDELIYTFDEPGAIEIGCHQPGHYEAGMKIAVTVT